MQPRPPLPPIGRLRKRCIGTRGISKKLWITETARNLSTGPVGLRREIDSLWRLGRTN